jgi:hypothetical protein
MATYEENLAQMSQPYQFAPLPIRGGGQDRAFTGLLGNIFGGGGATGLEEYLTAAQTEQMNRQALLQAAIAASQASAPSTVPRSFMQILGAGLAGGQQGYQQAQQGALTQLLTKQKLDEYKRKQALQKMLMQGLIGDQAAPTMAAEPQTQFPMAGEVITPMQSQIIGRLPFGPTNDRASLIGQTMPEGFAPPSLPAVSVSAKPRTPQDIFSSLSPQQRLLVANDPESLLPKVFEESMRRESFETVTGQDAADLGLDPRGRYQINYRTNQISTLQAPSDEFKIVTGLEAESYGLNGSSKWQVNKTSKQATLVPSAPGIFGGGIQGDASNIVIDAINSGKTDTVQYALAFRALNMPIPTEEMQADGSLKIVYKQPSPLPASFPQPTFKGKIPAVTKPVTVVPSTGQAAPAPVTARAQAPAPAVSLTEGATAAPLPAGVKSTPMAPRPEEISKSRESINAGVDFVAALNKMENMVRDQGMQLGGIGEKGASQSAIYEDLLTKARLAAQLGVLNKEDLPRLQAQLSDPTALSTYIRGLGGPSAFYAQIGELRSRIVDETTRKNLQFGQPIMQLPSTFSIAAPAPISRTTTVAPPPAIQNLLNKYNPARKP